MRAEVNLTYISAHPEICALQAEAWQRSIASEAIKSRGIRGMRQYGLYFAGMWAYGLVKPIRAALIRSAYFWFRHVDDVVDGDKPLPAGYQNQQEFMQEKVLLVQQISQPDGHPVFGDPEDILLADYFSLAKRLRIDLSEESLAVLDTIALDEERARTRRVLSQRELNDYFDKLDFACIGGALKVAGETCDSGDLSSLSWAVRTMFNLRDFPRDFAQGIINISREEMQLYDIDLDQLQGRATVTQLVEYEPMNGWYAYQTAMSKSFLHAAKNELRRLSLRPLTRLALNRFFITPVESTLRGFVLE